MVLYFFVLILVFASLHRCKTDVISQNNRYVVHDVLTTRSEHETYCANHGSHLASIHSNAEQTEMKNLVQSMKDYPRAYIGLKLPAHQWKDGSNYDYEDPNFDISGDGDCIEMDCWQQSCAWNDLTCNGNFYGVCNYAPSWAPTPKPTKRPTQRPTPSPSPPPSNDPSKSPTKSPTQSPSPTPSTFPTATPTFSPTLMTVIPTMTPTNNPSDMPTLYPTETPSFEPSLIPTNTPTLVTYSPTKTTNNPTFNPTKTPTTPNPTLIINSNPTFNPTYLEDKIDKEYSSTVENQEMDDTIHDEKKNKILNTVVIIVATACVFCIGLLYIIKKWRNKKRKYNENVRKLKMTHIESNTNGYVAPNIVSNIAKGNDNYNERDMDIVKAINKTKNIDKTAMITDGNVYTIDDEISDDSSANVGNTVGETDY
eukprot:94247_1